jgi:uridine phosphorylase
MTRGFPILEFDPRREAVIEPRPLETTLPRGCVLCFFHEVIDRWRKDGTLQPIAAIATTIGAHPIYGWTHAGQEMAVVHPGLGAPLAALVLEELVASGCQAFVACGGAGVLRKDIAAGHLIVPTSAVRDEGTSYHYVEAGRTVAPSPAAVQVIEDVLTERGIAHLTGATWTTDAVYRETADKIASRKTEGCLTVEMEAAALFAVAAFRRVALGQILYGGDDVSGLTQDRREAFDRTAIRELLIHLAAEACARLTDGGVKQANV